MMGIEDAKFLIKQLEPILKRTRWYLTRLKLDPENEDIEVCNMFGAVFYRIHYPEYRMAGALKKIMEEVYG